VVWVALEANVKCWDVTLLASRAVRDVEVVDGTAGADMLAVKDVA
jgi:hypothetical protein